MPLLSSDKARSGPAWQIVFIPGTHFCARRPGLMANHGRGVTRDITLQGPPPKAADSQPAIATRLAHTSNYRQGNSRWL